MSDEQKTAADWLDSLFFDNGAEKKHVLSVIKRIQNATLERAARVAEQGLTTFSPLEIARAIRNLKEPS